MTDIKKVADAAVEEAKKIAADSDGWNTEMGGAGEPAILEAKKFEGSDLNCYRVKGTVDRPPKFYADKMWSWKSDEWKKFATDVEKWEIKKSDGDNDRVLYQINKLPWPIWNRDFGMVMSLREFDGNYILVYKTIESDLTPKDEKNFVRGNVIVSFYLFEKGDKEGTTKVTRALHVDPAGNIPTKVINASAKSTFNVIKMLNDLK
eukprot:TRINITY_DN7261_c0_g1_i1.p1 TRINITY_DN7261_c0_g1~~TRINITY_DN7261_c0_g1_i1.p1  ORF type:complete len:205 (+),score=44.73 TRINITY_DN7261_c0_g1_i1:52-666(+)